VSREIDKEIAEKVMGECWHEFIVTDEHYPDPVTMNCKKCKKPDYDYDLELKMWSPINGNLHYSTNIQDAWLVVEKLKEKIYKERIQFITELECGIIKDYDIDEIDGGHDVIFHLTPMAICKAALNVR